MIQVVCGIIFKEGKIFIARRKKGKSLAGYWEFPGGKMEDDETPEVCLKRELEEELGVVVKVGKFFMDNEHQYKEESKIVLKAYWCELLSGEIILNDHDQLAWVEKDELLNYQFAPADIPFVKALCNE